MRPHHLRRRGFTLIELIVVILILGILAAIATIGYNQITERAKTTAASAQLTTIGKTILAQAAIEQQPTLDRDFVREAMSEGLGQSVTDGLTAAGWTLLGADGTPKTSTEIGIAFIAADNSAGDTGGLSAVLVTAGGDRLVGHLISLSGTSCSLGDLGSATSAATAAAAGTTCSNGSGNGAPGTVVPTPTPEPTPEAPEVVQLAAPTGITSSWIVYPYQFIQWDAVDGATGYKAVVTDTSDTVVASWEGAGTEFVPAGLTAGTTYSLTVTATAQGAVGTPSGATSFIAYDGYVAPATAVRATVSSTVDELPQDYKSTPGMQVTWTGALGATGYRVVATPSTGGAPLSVNVAGTARTAELTWGLLDGTAYDVTVISTGAREVSSEVVKVSTLSAPTNLKRVGADLTGGTFTATLPQGAVELRIVTLDFFGGANNSYGSGAPGAQVFVPYDGHMGIASAAALAVYPDGSVVASKNILEDW